ncbi:hypothetical protein FACHB389_03290 [Nostoc calcicola FACHB-389]|nr:hypothetical protein [Nostoc calcicola FACHB-3891]OKH41956.1 hypothetical protein FACHB389_03290 [Nostoc calcicola FACHB-389]
MIPAINSHFAKRRQLSAFACAIAAATISVDFISTKSIAQAQLLPVACPVGSETATYNPLLTNQVQNTTVTVTGTVGQCIGAQPISSGTYNFTATGPTSCNNIGTFPTYVITYNWNTGQSSQVLYTFTSSNVVGGQIILTSIGSVVSGLFQGRTVQRTIALLATDVQACSNQGLFSIGGPQTLIILGSL